jgi:methyltransferase (TIGR00027 family)
MTAFPPVLKTALWAAGVRARDAASKHPLVNDQLAKVLIGEEGLASALALERSHPSHTLFLRRTRLMDELIPALIVERGIQTVVAAGTGLDTRPYRLALDPALRWLELDYPVVVDWKNQHLTNVAPHCALERIGVDLSRNGALSSTITERCTGSRCLFVLENLIHYLSINQTRDVFRDIGNLGARTVVVMDLMNAKFEKSGKGRVFLAELEKKDIPNRTVVDDVQAFAKSLGFAVIEMIPLLLVRGAPATWRIVKRAWWQNPANEQMFRVVVLEKQ